MKRNTAHQNRDGTAKFPLAHLSNANANEAAPYQCSYSAIDWLRDRKPVHGVPHIGLDRSIFRDMLNETGGRAENPINSTQVIKDSTHKD